MTATATLQRHRPRDDSSSAIEDALRGLREDRAAAELQVAEETNRRAALLLSGSDREIRTCEESVRAAQLAIERIDVMTSDLVTKLSKAETREANDARRGQIEEAAASIRAFNSWFETKYEAPARMIAEGVALEREAIRQVESLRNFGAVPEGLPAIRHGYFNIHKHFLSNTVRLPAVAPGAPITWGDP